MVPRYWGKAQCQVVRGMHLQATENLTLGRTARIERQKTAGADKITELPGGEKRTETHVGAATTECSVVLP